MALNCHPMGGRSCMSVSGPKLQSLRRRRTAARLWFPQPVMDAAPFFSSLRLISTPTISPPSRRFIASHPTYNGLSIPCPSSINKPAILLNTSTPSTSRASAVINDGISAFASDPAQAEITWQIVIGALAGVAPFVVAGIEFSKRIVEQRNCKVCKGSGLVLRDNKYYFRCPGCGGFLPWQSWRRFFTG